MTDQHIPAPQTDAEGDSVGGAPAGRPVGREGARVDVELPGLVATDGRWQDPESPTWTGETFGLDWIARPRLVFGVAF